MSDEPKQPEANAAAQPASKPAPKPAAESAPEFLTAVSPHIQARDDVARIMWTVVVALLPALFASCYFFGGAAVRIILISVLAAVATEPVVQTLLIICFSICEHRRIDLKAMGREIRGQKITLRDGSAVVTGLLVAFVMPSSAPWFVPLVASVFAIAVVKMAFGGLGCNIWNPALAGRAFVVACFAAVTIGGWGQNWVDVTDIPLTTRTAPAYTRVDAMTGASALSARKDYLKSLPGTEDPTELTKRLGATPRETLSKVQQGNKTPYLDMLIGAQVGSLGETSALALLIGGAILLATGTIRWCIPASYLGTVALLGWLLPVRAPAFDGTSVTFGWVWAGGDPLFELLAGGVMLGAIFMATDMVTSPMSKWGKRIFGIGCGLLTVIIRKYGGYPEGVCYSILLMNTAVPLIDSFTKPRVYGTGKKQ